MSHTDIRDWKEFKGLGEAKIAQIKSAIEIGRRMAEEKIEEKPKIKSSKDIVGYFTPRMRDLKTEIFKIVLLNSKNKIMDIIEIVEGTVNEASPVIRDIFQKAAQKYAAAIICVHNHPSGDPAPSREDKEFTQKLTQAGKVLQINILDHIIIGDQEYYSFADSGLMN